jgi:MFS family permease
VVIILPQIGRALDVPDTRLQWVVSSYVLTFGCFLLLWGRIADIYGKRLIFILGSFWVTICCIVNAFIPTEIAFDLFRGLHGLVSWFLYMLRKNVTDNPTRVLLLMSQLQLVFWVLHSLLAKQRTMPLVHMVSIFFIYLSMVVN